MKPKWLRRQEADARNRLHQSLTVEACLHKLEERPGNSRREFHRLLKTHETAKEAQEHHRQRAGHITNLIRDGRQP
jgi:hypothetical protein